LTRLDDVGIGLKSSPSTEEQNRHTGQRGVGFDLSNALSMDLVVSFHTGVNRRLSRQNWMV
jgi:hypothetical protein